MAAAPQLAAGPLKRTPNSTLPPKAAEVAFAEPVSSVPVPPTSHASTLACSPVLTSRGRAGRSVVLLVIGGFRWRVGVRLQHAKVVPVECRRFPTG